MSCLSLLEVLGFTDFKLKLSVLNQKILCEDSIKKQLGYLFA